MKADDEPAILSQLKNGRNHFDVYAEPSIWSGPTGPILCKMLDWFPVHARDKMSGERVVDHEVAFLKMDRVRDLLDGEGRDLGNIVNHSKRTKQGNAYTSTVFYRCACGPEDLSHFSPTKAMAHATTARAEAKATGTKSAPTGTKRLTGKSQKIGCKFTFQLRQLARVDDVFEVRRALSDDARFHSARCREKRRERDGERMSATTRMKLRVWCVNDPTLDTLRALEPIRKDVLLSIADQHRLSGDTEAARVDKARQMVTERTVPTPHDYFLTHKDVRAVMNEVKNWP